MRLRLEGKGIHLAPILFILFMFFLPLGPTLKSVFFGCGVIAVLFTPYYNQYIFEAYNTLWGRSAVILFAFILLACLWSPAPYSMQAMVVGKYCKLIYLPILAVGFINPKTRRWCINSYLFSIFITCILSILKSKNLFEMGSPGDPGDLFYNHIITGFMVTVAFYLAGLFAFESKGWQRVIYVFLVLLTSYQLLFINTGRTGYVMYIILMALLFLQKLSFKKAVLGLLLFSAAVPLIYTQSTSMQNRLHDLMGEVKSLQANDRNTSIGYRIQFHNYAKTLFEQHPIIGMGTGSFKYSFSQDQPIPSWGEELNDPHSQYWMTLTEQGLIGISLLLLFLGSLFLTSFQLTETRPILLGILITFCIGSFSDTILCYSIAGYLLIVMSALCFGELIERRALRVSDSSVTSFSMQNAVS